MKKILGVSLVAVLAVSPLMAHADDLTLATHGTIVKANTDTGEIGDAARMATVSYVKGAYNELGEAINTKQDKINAGNKLNTDYVDTGANARFVTDDEKATWNAKQNAITAGENAISTSVTMSTGLANKSAESGTADNVLMSEKAVYTAIESAVSTADGAMDSRVDDLEEDVGTGTVAVRNTNNLIAAVGALDTALGTAEGTINKLDGAASVSGSVKQQIATALETAAADATSKANSAQAAAEATAAADATSKANSAQAAAEATAASALSTARTALESADSALSGRITTIEGAYATKNGVVATINASTVPVLATWGDATETTIAVNAPANGYVTPASEQ